MELYKFVQEGGTLITEGSTATIFPEYNLTSGITVESPTNNDAMSHFEAHIPANPIAQPPAAAALTRHSPRSAVGTPAAIAPSVAPATVRAYEPGIVVIRSR